MKTNGYILSFLLSASYFGFGQESISTISNKLSFEFLGDQVHLSTNQRVPREFSGKLTDPSISEFIQLLENETNSELITDLVDYRIKNKLDDWLFYQLIRRTAQQLSPKEKNYFSYTIYKWYLLNKTGYDALLRFSEQKLLLYVQCDEVIYNIPNRLIGNKQYVCLNFHDYGYKINFKREMFNDLALQMPGADHGFTYKVTSIPEFNTQGYIEKDIQFNFNQQAYHFKVKLNPEVKKIFSNYPVADYSSHFNIPLSKETYNSLIPPLKDIVGQMSIVNGVDYLMRFTRYSFLFEKDSEIFGTEKRFSPEETLLYDGSDCEDRAALFFYLVKEIYDLPMIVLAYPKHVTVAVQFNNPVGKPILYNGAAYYVCEPTPQKIDLQVGQLLPSLKKENFEVTYAYQPVLK